MEATEDNEFLTLRLALVTDCDHGTKKRKRKREETPNPSDSSARSFEQGKIFSLLKTREQMLRLDHRNRSNHHHAAHDDQEDKEGLHLIHLLLISATSLNQNNLGSAIESLSELYQNVCLTGDSVQRVTAFFADGLVARLLTRKSRFYEMIAKNPTPDEEFLSYTELYKVSPFYQFAHFTANQAILEAFEKEENSNNRTLHVIDFDISYGFQWPSLMQSLSDKANANNRILFKITGFGKSLEELQETESRLVSFAKGFRNLVFEFYGSLRGSSKLVKLKKKKNETVAVNLAFYLNSLNSFSKISETLKYVHSLSPSAVVLVEQEGSRKAHGFLPRLMDSLHYYAAIFDSLDDCLPLESPERLSIEKNHLGREIKTVINYENSDKRARFESMEMWRGRMENHGFSAIKQSSKSIMQAKLLLKMRCYCSPVSFDGEMNGGFRVYERDDGRAISLGWQERLLLTASSWSCV